MENDLILQIINIFSEPFKGTALLSAIIQIFLIFAILYAIFKKFIQGTSSEKLIKGIFILILGWLFGEILIKLNLQIIGTFIRATTGVIAISLVVIFQPELRRILSFIGQTNFWKKSFFSVEKREQDNKITIMQELTETVKFLSKTKTGGLIVLQNEENKSIFSEIGTRLDAKITSELLLTIFFPNTPLHDGAVVIQDSKIVAAGVLLPLTEDPKLSWRYGTRHRAAIGVTEVNDCACIVVSEETGDISIALDGTLKKYESIAEFKEDLSHILKIDTDSKKEKVPQKVLDFISFKPNSEPSKK